MKCFFENCLGDTLVTFKVTKITPKCLVFPNIRLRMPGMATTPPDGVHPNYEFLSRELKVLSVHGSSIYSQINEKLVWLKNMDSNAINCDRVLCHIMDQVT